jgi:hypothetical protein
MLITSGKSRILCRNLILVLAAGLSIFIGVTTATTVSAQNSKAASVLTVELDATVATEWMEVLYKCVSDESFSPPVASRVYAYAGITLYEAVLPGMPGNQSLSGQLHEMPVMPIAASKAIYDWSSVANGALAVVIAGLMPGASDNTRRQIAALRDKLVTEREASVPADVVNRSMTYGVVLGNTILDWAATDGFAKTRPLVYNLTSGAASYWTPESGKKAVEPFWGSLRPFALSSTAVCDVPLNVQFSSINGSEFYNQANEVKMTVDMLTDEQKTIADFWSDAPHVTGTPPGHWLIIESNLVDQLQLHLDKASEMYALSGIAIGDAFISTWREKYEVMLLRPVAYIQQNIDTKWKPYLATPSFPEYPSGHSVVSGAVAEVLTGTLGMVAFTDSSYVSRGFAARSFSSFEAAAREAAQSRLYGGIHYHAAIENGLQQGKCIGKTVLSNIHLHQ